jgi:hypothetical protein
MNRNLFRALFVTLICLAGLQRASAQSKLENGFQIRWKSTAMEGAPNPAAYDPEAKIEIFEASGAKLTTCHVVDVLRAADVHFRGVSIYDVSARRDDFIAVAAVYSRLDASPVAVLLYFDWTGLLSKKLVLENNPKIEALAIDNNGLVWALNDLDQVRPARSVFTVFNSNQMVVKEILEPHHRWSTDEGIRHGGQISFGLIEGDVWAWLPKTGTLVTVDRESNKATIRRTHLPRIPGAEFIYAQEAKLDKNGELVMDVGWRAEGDFHKGIFVWSARQGWQTKHAVS